MSSRSGASARPDLEAHLRRQSAACADLGSPMYEALLAFAADDYAARGPVADAFDGWTLEPGPAALALRLLGTVHRFALTGQAPELARFYPSVAGNEAEPFDPGPAWAAFRALLITRMDDVRAGLVSPPQTNEIGRSALLVGGLLLLRSRVDLPVRLVEIGASAGLNLRPDQVRIELPHGEAVGPSWSPVVLYDAWHGTLPPLPPSSPMFEVVERHGTDLDPVDVATAAGRLRLLSYVWPDQVGRVNRLRGAFDLAARTPVTVVQESALRTVAELQPVPGALTVVWHSIMVQYLPEADREALEAAFDALGALATADSPVARLAFEASKFPSPAGIQFGLRMTTWPGGESVPVASAHPHGDTVRWHRI